MKSENPTKRHTKESRLAFCRSRRLGNLTLPPKIRLNIFEHQEVLHVIVHHFLIKAGTVSLCDGPVSSNPKPRETESAFEDDAVGSLMEGSSR